MISGFMLKDAPAEAIVSAVRLVARGVALLAPAVTRAVIEEFARGRARPVGKPPGVAELNPARTRGPRPHGARALEPTDL